MTRPSAERLELLAKLLREKGVKQRAAGAIVRRGEPEAPLTFGQERLWFLEQYEPGTALYNDAISVELRGVELDEELFAECLAEVTCRHAALRTSFHLGPNGPLQRVHEGVEVPLEVEDLRGSADVRARVAERLREEIRGSFELDEAPLARACLLRTGDDEYVFALTTHHIVSDGASYGILHAELGELYTARKEGREPRLLDPAIEFNDWAAWEREELDEERIAAKVAYWEQALAGDLPAQRWPVTKKREGAPAGHRGAHHRFRLPDETYSELVEFCRREELTSNWVLLAAYFALLSSFGGQEDLRVGTPSSCRTRTELERVVGFLIHTIVLRLDLSGDPSFREVVERTRRATLDAAPHEDAPFDRVVRAVQPGRDDDRAPIIQAWFAHMRDLITPIELPGASASSAMVDGDIARFDLCLILDESRGALEGTFEYATDLFDAASVARIEERYCTLLHRVLAHPETRLATLRKGLDASATSGADGARGRGKLDNLKRTRRRVVEG